MKNDTTQCSAFVILSREDGEGSPRQRSLAALGMTLAAVLLASAASAQVLTITAGGRRVFDRDPESAQTNCLGWSYGAAPAIGDRGELVGMYTTSDALTQHCRV